MTITSFCSWSGGKDSCLALYRAINEGCEVKRLLTMMCDDREGSRSHGLPPASASPRGRRTSCESLPPLHEQNDVIVISPSSIGDCASGLPLCSFLQPAVSIVRSHKRTASWKAVLL